MSPARPAHDPAADRRRAAARARSAGRTAARAGGAKGLEGRDPGVVLKSPSAIQRGSGQPLGEMLDRRVALLQAAGPGRARRMDQGDGNTEVFEAQHRVGPAREPPVGVDDDGGDVAARQHDDAGVVGLRIVGLAAGDLERRGTAREARRRRGRGATRTWRRSLRPGRSAASRSTAARRSPTFCQTSVSAVSATGADRRAARRAISSTGTVLTTALTPVPNSQASFSA